MNRIAASTACKLTGIQDTNQGQRASARFGTVNVASTVLLPT